MDMPSCGEEPPPSSVSSVAKGPCSKCGDEKSFVVSRQRLLCAPCYKEAMTHQFKKFLQPIKRFVCFFLFFLAL